MSVNASVLDLAEKIVSTSRSVFYMPLTIMVLLLLLIFLVVLQAILLVFLAFLLQPERVHSCCKKCHASTRIRILRFLLRLDRTYVPTEPENIIKDICGSL